MLNAFPQSQYNVQNKEIRGRTVITDLLENILRQHCRWAGQTARKSPEQWVERV